MNRLLFICGSTATGKTALALKLAKLFNGQLISADSRQVYQGMDIGTGKDKPKKVTILGYDLVKPDQDFSVADFVKFTWKIIDKLWQKHKLPIVVGGTGLYLKHLLGPAPSFFIPPNNPLRQKLAKLTLAQLQARLQKLNPSRWRTMNQSDRHNPRRLVRALEIAQSNSQRQPLHSRIVFKELRDKVLWIGLKASLEQIDQRINNRVINRAQFGMTQEVKTLMKKYSNWNIPAFSATGYRSWRDYIRGRINRQQAIKLWQLSERQYARRQITWFKKNPQINWFDITSPSFPQPVVTKVKNWYATNS